MHGVFLSCIPYLAFRSSDHACTWKKRLQRSDARCPFYGAQRGVRRFAVRESDATIGSGATKGTSGTQLGIRHRTVYPAVLRQAIYALLGSAQRRPTFISANPAAFRFSNALEMFSRTRRWRIVRQVSSAGGVSTIYKAVAAVPHRSRDQRSTSLQSKLSASFAFSWSGIPEIVALVFSLSMHCRAIAASEYLSLGIFLSLLLRTNP